LSANLKVESASFVSAEAAPSVGCVNDLMSGKTLKQCGRCRSKREENIPRRSKQSRHGSAGGW